MALIKNLSLSVYAFGYGCGFVKDRRPDAAASQSLNLDYLVKMCCEHGLAGLEIPVDRYFPDLSSGALERFVEQMQSFDLKVVFDLETFSAAYFRELAPFVRRHGEEFVRAKVCNFYGGNRFREPTYAVDKERFARELQACVDVIDRQGVRILIENHQDVTVNDLLGFAERFGSHRVGVNWDTGNSFPTGETTTSFLEKTMQLIGNVHLKDYRLARTAGGYVMHRCALGRGVVDFERFIPRLAEHSQGRMPFSIELGAMVGREAFINDERYWTHTEGVSPSEANALRDFVSAHLEVGDLRSPWERNASPAEVAAAEFAEVIESIQFCKKMFNACLN